MKCGNIKGSLSQIAVKLSVKLPCLFTMPLKKSTNSETSNKCNSLVLSNDASSLSNHSTSVSNASTNVSNASSSSSNLSTPLSNASKRLFLDERPSHNNKRQEIKDAAAQRQRKYREWKHAMLTPEQKAQLVDARREEKLATPRTPEEMAKHQENTTWCCFVRGVWIQVYQISATTTSNFGVQE